MAQPSITNFFQKRKRHHLINDIKTNSKVLVVDEAFSSHELSSKGDGKLNAVNKVIYAKSENEIDRTSLKPAKHDCTSKSPAAKHSKRGNTSNPKKKTSAKKQLSAEPLPDIRKTFLNQTVKFELKGNLSPKKRDVEQSMPEQTNDPVEISDLKDSSNDAKCKSINASTVKEVFLQPSSSKSTDVNIATVNARHELGLMNPRRKDAELSLNEIKARLSRSAKLSQLRQSLAKIEKSNAKLKDIEQRKTQHEAANPRLGKFKTISMEVRSPMKEGSSPMKNTSPLSSPTKGPAFQRYSSLAVAGTPVLTLPYKHRCLTEMFRCVDTVVAMFYNRKEKITFSKLKPAVQQMLRKNFAESHLGQIKRILPNAFAFQQEKLHAFGASSRCDQYNLTVTPVLEASTTMLPSCLLERRKTFADVLTEQVKDHHEVFLSSLDPPLVIARDKLTRWHPEFDVDNVPDVVPDELPLPPNAEHYSTASDVLAKAKHIFSCNERMERALLRVSELSVKPAVVPPSPTKLAIASALRGIPKALLEKVRATQAAKAMVVMSRSVAQDRQGTQYSRLPEMARIIRNVFVAEKKGVLPMEAALQKIGNSYRENLPLAELDEHIQLLIASVPGWLEVHEIRKTRFLKLSKSADMTKVKQRLEALAAEKNIV